MFSPFLRAQMSACNPLWESDSCAIALLFSCSAVLIAQDSKEISNTSGCGHFCSESTKLSSTFDPWRHLEVPISALSETLYNCVTLLVCEMKVLMTAQWTINCLLSPGNTPFGDCNTTAQLAAPLKKRYRYLNCGCMFRRSSVAYPALSDIISKESPNVSAMSAWMIPMKAKRSCGSEGIPVFWLVKSVLNSAPSSYNQHNHW